LLTLYIEITHRRWTHKNTFVFTGVYTPKQAQYIYINIYKRYCQNTHRTLIDTHTSRAKQYDTILQKEK
jgi:hypothetical protein